MEMRDKLVDVFESIGGNAIFRFLNKRNPKILMYHRIHPMKDIVAVRPDVLEMQLQYLKENFNVMSLSNLVEAENNGPLENNSIILTFDDGYKDFYDFAWPLLKKYNLPATLFITTNFIDENQWLWPDLLKYIVLNVSKARLLDCMRKKNIPCIVNSKFSIWSFVADICFELSNVERDEFIEDLATQLNVTIPANPVPEFSSVSWHQLKEMHNEGLNIESHTVSHPVLSRLTDQKLKDELLLSKLRIEDELNISSEGICYPYGMAEDISKNVLEMARKHYRYGVVAYPSCETNNMKLGRWPVSNNMRGFKFIVDGVANNDNPNGNNK